MATLLARTLPVLLILVVFLLALTDPTYRAEHFTQVASEVGTLLSARGGCTTLPREPSRMSELRD